LHHNVNIYSNRLQEQLCNLSFCRSPGAVRGDFSCRAPGSCPGTSVNPFSASPGAMYGPLILQMPLASVHSVPTRRGGSR